MGVICMPHRWRSGAMGCGVRHAGCGLCAPAARGRGRESGQRRETAERRGARAEERDSIADGTALRDIVGEEVAATLRTSEIRLGGSFFV